MAVSTANAMHVETYEGECYYFCTDGCWSLFRQDPARCAAIHHGAPAEQRPRCEPGLVIACLVMLCGASRADGTCSISDALVDRWIRTRASVRAAASGDERRSAELEFQGRRPWCP